MEKIVNKLEPYLASFRRTSQLIYFLRFQIAGWLFLVLFPFAAKFAAPHMLLGLFDLSDRSTAVTGFLTVFVFSLLVFSFAWAVMIAAKITIRFGAARFELEDFAGMFSKADRGNRWPFVVSLLSSIPIFWLYLFEKMGDTAKWGQTLWGVFQIATGFVFFVFLLALIEYMLHGLHSEEEDDSLHQFLFPFSPNLISKREGKPHFSGLFRPVRWVEKKLARLPEWMLAGYLRETKGARGLHPEHLLAAGFFVFFLGVYIAFAFVGPFQPSIFYLLLLVSVFLWGLSGAGFFFDGFRIPAMLGVAVLLFGAAVLSLGLDPLVSRIFPTFRAAHVYDAEIGDHQFETPGKILAGQPDDPGFTILVAADGGGIQAAAWTARVITGLEKECARIFSEAGREYNGECGRSVKLISSVSGGSVGAMHVVNAYTKNGLPSGELDTIVGRASHSSLDAVSWGLAYPDTLRWSGLPLWKGWSRGHYLEQQWIRNAGSGDLDKATLGSWGADKWRPSIIFNSTVVETGARLMLTNTSFAESDAKGRSTFKKLMKLCGNVDMKVVTAARLSSSFPYVTPTARGLVKSASGYKSDCDAAEFHIADGGYYDNYGIASLANWIDEGLKQKDNDSSVDLKTTKILIVQILSSDVVTEKEGKASPEFFLQAYAPAITLYKIRESAQYANAVAGLRSLQERWNLRSKTDNSYPKLINTVQFMFESQKLPPLSWHLTQSEKEVINGKWDGLAKGDGKDIVGFRKFICHAADLTCKVNFQNN